MAESLALEGSSTQQLFRAGVSGLDQNSAFNGVLESDSLAREVVELENLSSGTLALTSKMRT